MSQGPIYQIWMGTNLEKSKDGRKMSYLAKTDYLSFYVYTTWKAMFGFKIRIKVINYHFVASHLMYWNTDIVHSHCHLITLRPYYTMLCFTGVFLIFLARKT